MLKVIFLLKKLVLIISLYLFLPGAMFAQGAQEDVLIPGFEEMADATRMEKIKEFLSRPTSRKGIENMRQSQYQMIALCKKNNFIQGEAYCYYRHLIMYRLATSEDSLVHFRTLIQDQYYDHLSCELKMRFHTHIANTYGETDQPDLAQKKFHLALALADSCGLSKNSIYNGLAIVNSWLGKDSISLKYLLLNLAEIKAEKTGKLEKEKNLALAYVNISSQYSTLGNKDSALVYAKNAVKLYRVPRTLIHQARLLLANDQYAAAEKNHNEAEKMIQENPAFKRDEPALLIGQSHCYRKLGKHDLAVAAAQKSLDYALQGKRKVAVYYAYALLTQAYLKDNAYLADSMGSLMNQINNREVQQTTVKEQTRFETVKKEKEILELNGQLKDQEIATLQFQSYLLYGGMAVLLLAGLIFLSVRRRQSRTERELENLRKQAVKLQMNPHFFFNVLNSINQYIAENDKKAARFYLAKFAKLMRLTLENSQEDTVSIGNEVDFLQNYLSLEQMRMQNFDFEFQVEKSLEDLRIPALLIQPLVENSLLHGFADIEYRGLLKIKIEKTGQFLHVEVIDNGVGKQKSQKAQSKLGEQHRSFALRILHQRLVNYSNQAVNIVYEAGVKAGDNLGTKVSFRFPII
ncbi:MAG TPA: hypothetical protein ENJ82_10835 [Bacteroidetes bacterium]|nr:hypothetical protein [Bacteroidota bacterium]